MVDCKSCAVGRYGVPFSSQIFESGCALCPAGKYQGTPASSSCSYCAAGQTSTEEAPQCAPCAAGTITAGPGLSSCAPCNVGESQPLQGQSACDLCSAGHYSDTTGQTACSLCSQGQFQEFTGQTTCDVCRVGATSANLLASISCVNCTAGLYSDDDTAGTCHPCQLGRFRNDAEAALRNYTVCTACPIGKSTAAESSTTIATCTDCVPGTYQSWTTMVSTDEVLCDECPAGTFTSTSGAGACSGCAAGRGTAGTVPHLTYTGTTLHAAPEELPAAGEPQECWELCVAESTCTGWTFTLNDPGCAASGGPPTCTMFTGTLGTLSTTDPCTASGAVAPKPTVCVDCTPGLHSPGVGNGCVMNPPNEGGSADAVQQGTDECPSGKFSLSMALTCTDCPEGKFGETPAGSGCTYCPPGKYQGAAAQTSCHTCAAGYYQAKQGDYNCAPCGYGHYGTTAGATSPCTPCPSGTYQNAALDATALTDCLACPAATPTSDPGADSCSACGAGTYVSGTTCILCPAGKWNSAANAEGGLACAGAYPGHYTPNDGAAVQLSCGPGSYQTIGGQTSCLACTPGRFSTTVGATLASYCTECPAGKYQGFPGHGECDSCGAGQVTDQSGAAPAPSPLTRTTCLDCELNYFSTAAQGSCSACAPGSITNVAGSANCVTCATGKISAGSGAPCTACGSGHFSPVPPVACLQCTTVQLKLASEALQCGVCAPGQEMTVGTGGTVGCEGCALGKFNPSFAATCTACPLGKFYETGATGAGKTCQDCSTPGYGTAEVPPIGSAIPPTALGSVACAPCKAGAASWSATGTSHTDYACAQCAPGLFSATTLSVACTSCSAGTSNTPPVLGAATWSPGDYAPTADSTSCTACPSGKFAAAAGAIACATCPVGTATQGCPVTYCEAGSYSNATGSCDECPAGQFLDMSGAHFSCQPCSGGSVAPTPGSTQCSKCVPGQMETASTGCVACAAGKVQPLGGQDVCLTCPVTVYAPNGTAVLVSTDDQDESTDNRTACQSGGSGWNKDLLWILILIPVFVLFGVLIWLFGTPSGKAYRAKKAAKAKKRDKHISTSDLVESTTKHGIAMAGGTQKYDRVITVHNDGFWE